MGSIKRVKLQKLHFIKLLEIYAFSYRKATHRCCIDDRILLGGHGVIMFCRKSFAATAFVLKLLFTKFQLVCYILYKNQTYNYL